jgi:glutamine amidotransferase
MVAIIDYDAGNIRSVEKALQFLGEDVVITRDKEVILRADKVILPGVGAFGDAISRIRSYHLEEVIKQVVDNGTPFLGICLGLQILFESSDEAIGVRGLGILEGEIKRFPENVGVKIPHMGWNSLEFPKESKLLKGLSKESYVYFVHSYYLEAKDASIVAATTEYDDINIHAAVEKGNVFACQFHPEKSGDVGLAILKNFLALR